MAVLTYIKYKTNVKSTSPRFGKYYGRVHHRETVDLDGLTKHIMDHGSIFTEDVVAGVLKKFKNCLIELLLDSKKVKIDGLGTFYLAVKSKGAESAEAFTSNNIKSAHIRFLADQSAKTNLSGPQLLKVAQLREDNEYSGGASGSGGNGNGSGNLPIEDPEP